MNRFRRLVIPALGALVGLLLTSSVAMAQQNTATSATVDASAEIVTAIGITHGEDMDFGRIITGSGAGTVELDPAAGTGGRTGTGVTLGNPGTVHAAIFTVTGDHDAAYTVDLPDDGVELTGPALSDPMHIDAFTASITLGSGSLTAGPGEETFYVGGTLQVNAGQDPGAYAGTFTVTVTYN